MEAVLPIAQPKEDHLSKPTIRIEIPLLSGKNSNAPTIVDIAEVMAKYREQLGESSEDEDYEDGMEEEEGLEGEEDDDEDSDSSDDEEDEEDSLDEIEERELSPSEIENMLPAGPKTNRYTGVIERIERMYGGEYSKGRKQDDYDFEDSFIDDSDWKTYSDAPKTKHDGFFINKGTLELASEESESSAQAFQEGKKKKRKRSLDKDGKEIKAKESSGDAKDKKERPKKKTKTGSADSSPAKEGEGKKGSKIQALTFQSASPSSASSGQFAAPKPKAPAAALSPSVESAIQALERAIPLHPLAEGGKKRLPRELDAHLYQVALEARKTHPHGHIAANVTQRLIKSLPFNERTLKHHMKRVLESKTGEEEERLEAKIDSLLDELKTKVDKMRGLNPTAKWKWDRETGNLLCTIFELVDNRVELHNKLHEKDTELKLSDRKERKKVADEIAKFWPADQMTGADILKKNTIIKSNRKRATGKPDGGSTIEGKEKEKEKEKEKKDGKKDSAQKESKRDTDKSKADKKEKKQQKEEKKKERKEEKKLRKEEKKKSSDKKASGDDRKVAAERKPSPTTAPQPLASPPPPTTAAQAQPSATPIVRQAVPLPPLPSVITRVTAEEDDDVIILS